VLLTRIVLQLPIDHVIHLGSTHSSNTFTLSASLSSAPGPGAIKDFGATKRVASAKRSQEGHWCGAKGIPGLWAAGPGRLRDLLRRAGVAKKGQALAFADLARMLGAVDVAHMRSALGLSGIYRQQKGCLPFLRKISTAAFA
jgi:hypothetical protein